MTQVSFSDLPADIRKIYLPRYLSAGSILSLGSTSSEYRSLSTNRSIWTQTIERDFKTPRSMIDRTLEIYPDISGRDLYFIHFLYSKFEFPEPEDFTRDVTEDLILQLLRTVAIPEIIPIMVQYSLKSVEIWETVSQLITMSLVFDITPQIELLINSTGNTIVDFTLMAYPNDYCWSISLSYGPSLQKLIEIALRTARKMVPFSEKSPTMDELVEVAQPIIRQLNLKLGPRRRGCTMKNRMEYKNINDRLHLFNEFPIG